MNKDLNRHFFKKKTYKWLMIIRNDTTIKEMQNQDYNGILFSHKKIEILPSVTA